MTECTTPRAINRAHQHATSLPRDTGGSVELGFNETKQWRGLATRYDKLALTYRGGAVLRAIMLWLTAVGDTP